MVCYKSRLFTYLLIIIIINKVNHHCNVKENAQFFHVIRGSLAFSQALEYHMLQVYNTAFSGTHCMICIYPGRDGQAELTWGEAGYTQRQFTHLLTVTHPSSKNRPSVN